MPEKQSDSCRYQSRFGGGYITVNNYIVEEVCQRIALKDKLGSLPVRFWSLPKWKKIYMQQLLLVNGLLKIYSPQAVIAGLRRHPNVYSLRATWLDDTFKEEQVKIEKQLELDKQREAEKLTKPVEEALPAQEILSQEPRPAFSNQKSIKSKLRDLD